MGRDGQPGHRRHRASCPRRLRHAGAVGARAVPADLAAGVGRQPDPEAGAQRARRRTARRADRRGASAVPLAAPLRRGVHRPGRRARGAQRRDGGGGEHVPVPRRPVLRRGADVDRADAQARRQARDRGSRRSRRPTTRWTATTPTTRSTCRTPRRRAPTRSTWPAGWATGWCTCTCATAAAHRPTSTWCRAAAPSRPWRSARCWPAATSPAT